MLYIYIYIKKAVYIQNGNVIYIYTYIYDVVYIHNGILFGRTKEGNNAIHSEIDGPRDYWTKWTKLDEDIHRMISLICEI